MFCENYSVFRIAGVRFELTTFGLWARRASRLLHPALFIFNGWRRIRTFEVVDNRFTVCPLWPLGNPSIRADDRTRTDNLLITNQLLCQLSHIGVLLHSLIVKWDLQGSNLWPSACKADALPAELRPQIYLFNYAPFCKRPGRGSNPRPPPWQGGALTSWATGPS